MDKLLLYTTVGKSEKYIELLACFCESLCFTNTGVKNLLVICDMSFYTKVRTILERFAFLNWHIMDMPDTFSGIEASMQKTKIFDWPHIMEYNTCLFVDVDCLFLQDLEFLFAKPIVDNKLYVYAERDTPQQNIITWFCLPQETNSKVVYYTQTQIQRIIDTNKLPFNAGLFLFRISPLMKSHFKALNNFIKNWKGEYFYEQSFMNTYFHLTDLSDYSHFDKSNIVMTHEKTNQIIQEHHKLVHFNGVTASNGGEKQKQITAYFNNILKQRVHSFITFDNRLAMINALIPEHATIAEIGVFKGQFALELLKRTPKHLYLIDCWLAGPMDSGDQDGNNMEHIPDSEVLYNNLKDRLKFYPNVSLHRQFSTDFLPLLKDNTLDVVYIDGDHSYEGVKKDLELSYPKIKKYGWIMGHDYEMNHAKTKYIYNFGTKRAVDEFCAKYNLKIYAKGMDGCVSYAIWNVPNLVVNA
jgi:hypothetical protein